MNVENNITRPSEDKSATPGGARRMRGSSFDATERVGLRSNAALYPCDTTVDTFSQRASWRGMRTCGIRAAMRSVEQQNDY